jgi:tetratricopeptide (TPR) repeat protein
LRSIDKSAVVLLLLGLAAAGCNRGPAEEALGVAEQALTDAQADLERFAPEKLAPLRRALADARAALAEGRYTEALRVAQELPARTRRAVEAADRRRTAELAVAWDDISRTLPAQLARLRARIAGLALTPGPGASPDGGRLEAARGELRALGATWEEATATFAGGDVAQALTMAHDVGTRAEALARALPPRSVRRVEPLTAPAPPAAREPHPR